MAQSRLEEHQAFLVWLLKTIEQEKIDILLVSGDIFDTTTPPNYALELYYNFLTQCSKVCKHIVITAGNHDSVATLKAPQQLLETLHIHVITNGEEENEVLPLYKEGKMCAIVCAVPFLRDGVVRKSLSGESLKEKEKALTLGIQEHYKRVYQEALKLKGSQEIPIIAMGHLTTLGSQQSDSEREIYIGNTLSIESSFLENMFDYVALGHLHVSQRVGNGCVYYSGSPIPLSFSEATTQKSVQIVVFERLTCKVTQKPIPLYRKLIVLQGDMKEILKELESIEEQTVWIEVHLRDENPMYANEIIRKKAQELGLSILALKIDKKEKLLHNQEVAMLSLDEVSPLEVFLKRLEKEQLKDETLQKALIQEFTKILDEVNR